MLAVQVKRQECVVFYSPFDDFRVRRAGHSEIPDVVGRMAEGAEDAGQTRRHGLVEQELHNSGGDHGLELDRAFHCPRVELEL